MDNYKINMLFMHNYKVIIESIFYCKNREDLAPFNIYYNNEILNQNHDCKFLHVFLMNHVKSLRTCHVKFL